ncbi:hypothetical protein BV25DRAFT_1880072 [Artomyces pyxidatus]|uniref:Uncharacterized protein n=1 Tax=Artomyces pyxidatus TaxID=48021 RepID=A0ACB8T8X0_9AGAM|nr:hypothetical protein BV25DRAFT_1880072 [Artomyces pyxidatus]
MDYFSKFLRSGTQPTVKPVQDNAAEFHKSWLLVKNTLLHPDERQLSRGIKSTDVPAHLKTMVDLLVLESTRAEEGATGACLEYLLKNDVLGTLVRLSEADRPSGIQAEVLRSVQNMVILLDEQFLVHSAVHKAVLRLLRNCVGEDIQEQLDNRSKVMGAARNAVRSSPSEYEEDLVNLLCILCSRIRTFRELLMIFFHDKHWFHSEPLFAVEEEDEDAEEEDDIEEDNEDAPPEDGSTVAPSTNPRTPSPAHSQETVKSAPASSNHKKTEYEFLLFNYLLRFVHREGQIGDFARAGLLFLMDVAMSPGDQVHRLPKDDALSSSSSATEVGSSDPITDAALSLAEYILDGDFSEVLGAGLGAVYSLLPSKLEIRAPDASIESQGTNMILGSNPIEEKESDAKELAREKNRALGMEDSRSPDFRSRLDHFLKLLEFLEDVFRRNVVHDGVDSSLDASALVGSAIVQSILDAVRRIFMENVLYPSILECSDTDGSAVAVMSYIEIMIRTLENGQLAELLVNFLMSEDNDDIPRVKQRPQSMLNLGQSAPPQAQKPDAHKKLHRRQSSAMLFLEMEAPESRKPSEYFTAVGRFTLKDLLLTNLRSKDQPTATSALQLLQSLLHRHNQLCVDRLLIVIRDPQATSFPEPPLVHPVSEPRRLDPERMDEDEETFIYPGAEEDSTLDADTFAALYVQPGTTYATHEREMGLYLKLVSRVDPLHVSDTFSTGYDKYLTDALASIQEHSSFRLEVDEEPAPNVKHRLDPNDPILSLVLEWLRKFLSNSPEFNIALTGVLASLAYDPNRSLAGWLTFGQKEAASATLQPPGDSVIDPVDDGDDRSVDYKIEELLASESRTLPASSLDDQSRPVVHTIFQGLVAQLERYRQLVDDFDKYLLERRQGLLFSENLTDALTLALDLDDPNATPHIRPSASVTMTPDSPQKLKPVPKKSNSFVSFLTPKKTKPSASAKPSPAVGPSEPGTPSKNVAASPFGPHYQHTGSIVVEPFDAPAPLAGPWTPARPLKFSAEEEDVFTAGWGESRSREPPAGSDWREDEKAKRMKTVTLSQLLDNVVILEESIKELVAIIHARRSLGIDSVRYL